MLCIITTFDAASENYARKKHQADQPVDAIDWSLVVQTWAHSCTPSVYAVQLVSNHHRIYSLQPHLPLPRCLSWYLHKSTVNVILSSKSMGHWTGKRSEYSNLREGGATYWMRWWVLTETCLWQTHGSNLIWKHTVPKILCDYSLHQSMPLSKGFWKLIHNFTSNPAYRVTHYENYSIEQKMGR